MLISIHFVYTGLAAALLLGSLTLSSAAAMDKLELGVIDNTAGPVEPNSHRSTMTGLQMAREDFEVEPDGTKVELHVRSGIQPADVAAAAEHLLGDERVDAVVELGEGSASRLIGRLAAQHDRAAVVVDPNGFDERAFCEPTTIQWGGGTEILGESVTRALSGAGAKTWFFVTGSASASVMAERAAERSVKALGDSVLGEAPFLPGPNGAKGGFLQAAKSGADAVAFGSNGLDLSSVLRAASSLGLSQRADLAALDMDAPDITGIGTDVARRLFFATTFYPHRNVATQSFAARFAKRTNGHQPTRRDASAYVATLALLEAVQRTGSADGRKVVDTLEKGPVKESLLGQVTIGADRVAKFASYVLHVTPPGSAAETSRNVSLVATIPADQAFPQSLQARCSPQPRR